MAAPETRLFINGQFVPSLSGKTFPVVNPTTEEKVADVFEADPEDVDVAVAAAKTAFPAWRDLSAHDRIAKVLRLGELMEQNAQRLAELEAVSMGLPVSLYVDCVLGAVAGLRHTAGLAHDIHGETSLNTPGVVNFSLRQPFGVVGAIIPWNVPVIMWTGKVVPCLLAGNTLVLKSSEKAPLTSLVLAGLAADAGIPPGVLNVLSGFGATAGAALAHHMDVRKICFTGSTRAGRLVMQAAGKSNMKSVCCEMGGKNPSVVFEDADIDRAVSCITSSMQFNSGQICVSNSRIYVQRGVFARFLEAFRQSFTNVKMGDPLDKATLFGPQVDKIQFDNILRLIDEAKTEGGQVVAGGARATDRGYFVQPTIFVQLPEQAKIMKAEVFGPVVAVQQFDSEDEVVAQCNDTAYGLHASVFTQDISRAYRVATAFEAGMVGVNCSSETHPYDMPFGGWKQSGVGREQGRMGLEAYYEVKSVSIRL